MAKVCSVCGTTNADDAQFCEGCGVELMAAQPGGEAAPTPGEAPAQDASLPSPDQGSDAAPSATASDGEASPDGTQAPSQDSSSSDAPLEPDSVESPASSAADAGSAKLLAKRHGAVSGDAIPLMGERLVVGRFDPSTGPVDIDVSGMAGAEHISRRHAELYVEAGRWKVRDLGSSNGVFLKRAGEDSYGPRLQEPADLNDGDEIAFGNVIFVFRRDGP